MAARPPLLFIFSGGDEADQTGQAAQGKMIKGSTDLGRLLPDEVVRHRMLITRDFRPGAKVDFSDYPVIVNMITEAERSPRILKNVGELLRDFRGKLVNRPQAVLRSTRDQVAALLTGIDGLIVPKTVRFRGDDRTLAARAMADAGFEFPIILRQAGTHSGKIAGLFGSAESALDAVEAGKDYIATQFVDFRSPDGFYRKYRVYFIGTHRIARHLLIFDKWTVHGHARADFMAPRSELIAEERALLEGDNGFPPAAEQAFDEIRRRMPLDFFGMDFSLAPDGRVILFEANATMSFMPNLFVPGFDYLQRCFALGQAAFMELLDLEPPPAGPTLSGPGPGPRGRASSGIRTT